MKAVGLIGLIGMLPFVLKIFLGILSDRVNLLGFGFRKPYILIGVAVQMLALIVVPFINPGLDFWLYALVGFLLMSGMALYDTATDGLALDTTPEEEQGTIQGLMVGAGRWVTVISIFFGFFADFVSWRFPSGPWRYQRRVLIIAVFIHETRLKEKLSFACRRSSVGTQGHPQPGDLGLYSFIINSVRRS